MIRQRIKRMHHGRPLFKYHQVSLVSKAPLLASCWRHFRASSCGQSHTHTQDEDQDAQHQETAGAAIQLRLTLPALTLERS